MADQKKLEFGITEGPPRDALIAALFFDTEKTPYRVSFTVLAYGPAEQHYGFEGRVFEVIIDGAKRDDIIGRHWHFEGCVCNLKQRFTCYYDTKVRKGTFTMIVGQ